MMKEFNIYLNNMFVGKLNAISEEEAVYIYKRYKKVECNVTVKAIEVK